MRIREDVFDYPVATVRLRIGQPVKEAIPLRIFDQVLQVALFFVAKRLAVGDQKLKVARVRLIDAWIVNLIDDAVTKCEPETATGMISPRLPSRSKSSAARFRAHQTLPDSQSHSSVRSF